MLPRLSRRVGLLAHHHSWDLSWLGTASAMPLPHRNVSALALRNGPDLWIFDVGEGTQAQALRAGLRLSRLSKVFITHLHGDHVFGLPSLLCYVNNAAREQRSQALALRDAAGAERVRRAWCWGCCAARLTGERAARFYRGTSLETPPRTCRVRVGAVRWGDEAGGRRAR